MISCIHKLTTCYLAFEKRVSMDTKPMLSFSLSPKRSQSSWLSHKSDDIISACLKRALHSSQSIAMLGPSARVCGRQISKHTDQRTPAVRSLHLKYNESKKQELNSPSFFLLRMTSSQHIWSSRRYNCPPQQSIFWPGVTFVIVPPQQIVFLTRWDTAPPQHCFCAMLYHWPLAGKCLECSIY